MRNYWWPGISKYVLSYVDGCDVCQRGKAFPEMPVGKLMQNPIPNVPWTDISMDFTMGLLEAQGYDAILDVCNWEARGVRGSSVGPCLSVVTWKVWYVRCAVRW